uniref:Nuclear receptor domain-containing protein n=1 Tax=Parascaris univalens TaxID=6257 RepID=A0A915B341_PARUN
MLNLKKISKRIVFNVSYLSSGSSGSVTGTPSPLNQPASPPFGASANLMRFSVFNDPVGGSSSGLQATAAAAAPETVGEEKLCAVCSDRAVCQHYGARTCEGCKGFFKRTVQKKAQYVCTGNKNCTIDKRFRSRCQYCRFQKCIAVGMVKEVVRYGSLSGRRGRLPSKTKLVHSDDPPSPPLPLLTLINKAYNDSKSTPETYTSFNGTVEQLLLALDEEFGSLVQFVEKIPGSSEISHSDTVALIEQNFFALVALKLCNRRIGLEWTIYIAQKLHMRILPPVRTEPQVEAFAKFECLGAEALSACVAAGAQLPVRINGVLLRSGQQPSASTKIDFGEFSFCP